MIPDNFQYLTSNKGATDSIGGVYKIKWHGCRTSVGSAHHRTTIKDKIILDAVTTFLLACLLVPEELMSERAAI